MLVSKSKSNWLCCYAIAAAAKSGNFTIDSVYRDSLKIKSSPNKEKPSKSPYTSTLPGSPA